MIKGKVRYVWNVISGIKRTMLNAGATEEPCPHCGQLTPIYYHPGYKGVSSCLWCGKGIDERFCQLCKGSYRKGETPWVDDSLGIYDGAHKVCLERLKRAK